MVEMMIFSVRQAEVQAIYRTSKDFAARMTEEKWEFHCFADGEEMGEFVKTNPLLDMICMDVSAVNSLSAVQELRKKNKHAYITLIASPKTSPALYMRPSIQAASLMLRPLEQEQVQEVMEEAFREFAQRFQKSDETEQFVIDNREGKWLVDYEQINYFEAREKKIFLNTDTREIAFYDTMENLEQSLPDYFIRCHRGFMINGKKIEKLLLGQNLVVLKKGWEIPVSRSYKQTLKEYIA